MIDILWPLFGNMSKIDRHQAGQTETTSIIRTDGLVQAMVVTSHTHNGEHNA